MIIVIGIVLSFFGIGFLCWLLFTLAVQALPFFAAVAAGFAAHRSGAGETGAILVGLTAGAFILAVGQIAIATLRSPFLRAAVALIFAAPAAVVGYHAALGLAQIGVPAEGWRQVFALLGAIAVGGTAWVRMALSAPRDTRHGDASDSKSPVSLASVARDGWATGSYVCPDGLPDRPAPFVVDRIRAEYGTSHPPRSEFTSAAFAPPLRDKERLFTLRCVESNQSEGWHDTKRSQSGTHQVAGGMSDRAPTWQSLQG